MLYDDLTKKEQLEKLSSQIAELREVFPFPKAKDYDKGYDWSKKDGWNLSEICSCPHLCLGAMIRVLKGGECEE
tara:strand:+ start:43 stop:264 length:222 start_codon:yes stop_codon:yes gene_type:complete